MQKVRGVLAGILVAVPLAIYVHLWLHGVVQAAALIGGAVGVAIALVVGTRSDAHDAAADAAWRERAGDLPPILDRLAMERAQVSMPGPDHQHSQPAGLSAAATAATGDSATVPGQATDPDHAARAGSEPD
jgi:hypothetical protein